MGWRNERDINFLMIIYDLKLCIASDNPIHVFHKSLSLPLFIFLTVERLFFPDKKTFSS